ncbi:inositol monophosphatase [Ciceribacter sp. L1K22]|uniref:inositol monophosphatase family protein n=1 Tax=Ciceribacter sp. L1K22 TaxID=2820275 RepID=UPI001ABDBB68|nr:inositol monophosphatase [Ciceribacter sp. L1K22]MBO3761557.1 inositol monophosphatase [Ciceribacter sp. L1K22]
MISKAEADAFAPKGLEAIRDEIIDFLRLRVKPLVTASVTEVWRKGGNSDGDVVTNVDYDTQEILFAFLTKLYKDSYFFGEENFQGIETINELPLWIVDPLDGTVNFASRIPFYSISICLVVSGRPVLAVVFDLVGDVVYDAIVGCGARVDKYPLVWSSDLASRSPTAITSGFLYRYLLNAEGRGGAKIRELLGPKIRILGSQALQLCWAAEGRLRLTISAETKLWDEAAGVLICLEAGAGHMMAGRKQIFPLFAGDAATTGKSMTTVAGDQELVTRVVSFIEES